jgi:DNA sulfur modification protein DndD
MLIRQLEMSNFGPYNGRHIVDLAITPHTPVVLVYGENERGKTSFANAIRWCLYGKARGRGGREISTVSLMNYEALDGQIYNTTVRLDFEHAGQEYRLTRHVQASRRPATDRDLDALVSLEIDGSVQPSEHAHDIISGILHQDISRFFLFDGEMLSEYEDLLNDPDRAPVVVKQSIEEILGLPALQRGERDLEDLRVSAERKQLQEARKSRQNERLVRDAAQKEEELNAVTEDIGRNIELKQRLDDRRTELRQGRERFAETQAEVKLLDEREAQAAELLAEMEEARRVCRSLVRSNWWMPLEARIQAEIQAVSAAESADRERLRRVSHLRHEISGAEAIVSGGPCSQCGQPVPESQLEALRAHLESLKRELRHEDGDEGGARQGRERGMHLRTFAGSNSLPTLYAAETALRRLRLRHGRTQRHIVEVKARVRDHDRAEIQQLERAYDECVLQLEGVTRLLHGLEAQKIALRNVLERLRQEIRALPGADRQLAAEATLLGAIETLFERGIEAFKEQVRHDVEEEATRIHQMLTSEPDYDRLRINAQYGLILQNREGRTIRSRSAGSEQILALSLIGALNKCATREAPVIMDTPFGRLDVTHRANMLRFAPTFGAQVILLVQSGEFDRRGDMEHLAGRVAREYRIVRDGASDRSRIEVVRMQGGNDA